MAHTQKIRDGKYVSLTGAEIAEFKARDAAAAASAETPVPLEQKLARLGLTVEELKALLKE